MFSTMFSTAWLTVKLAIIMITLTLIVITQQGNALSIGGNESMNSTGADSSNSINRTNTSAKVAQSSSLGEVRVSIVPGAATLGNKAFSPNPVKIGIGTTVTWVNDDDSSPAFHTITSGAGSEDPKLGKEFDSGLTGPTALVSMGDTFSHKFNTTGEYAYFCQLHPVMIGKVIVS
jgi:plastocyanin